MPCKSVCYLRACNHHKSLDSYQRVQTHHAWFDKNNWNVWIWYNFTPLFIVFESDFVLLKKCRNFVELKTRTGQKVYGFRLTRRERGLEGTAPRGQKRFSWLFTTAFDCFVWLFTLLFVWIELETVVNVVNLNFEKIRWTWNEPRHIIEWIWFMWNHTVWSYVSLWTLKFELRNY